MILTARKAFCIVVASYSCLSSYAQTNTVPTPTGNVGIGTTSTPSLFSVGTNSVFRINTDGVTSVNTTQTSGLLNIQLSENTSTYPYGIYLKSPSHTGGNSLMHYGIYGDLTSSNNYDEITGAYFDVKQTVGYSAYGFVGKARAVYREAVGIEGHGIHEETGAPGVAIGVRGVATAVSSSGGTLGFTYAGYFDNKATSGNKNYGIYIKTSSSGTYGLVQDGGAPNLFTGNIGIGTTAPGAKLSFTNMNQTEEATGISWYSGGSFDPTLYGIHRTAGPWTAPAYQQLRMGWETGIILDPGVIGPKSYVDVKGNGLRLGSAGIRIGSTDVNIGKDYPTGKISFTNVDQTTDAMGITWFSQGSGNQTVYAIHRTEGAWSAPDYQQLRLGWNTGIILDPGSAYGKSYVEVQGSGMRVSSGTVSIGASPVTGYKLTVAGNIITEKVRVKLQSGWPDYVFGKQYKLMPLSELEQYIQTHQHLPEIPSAREVEEKGVDLGDNQALLLKKIEELTLHMIELNKKVEALTEENKKLQEKK